MTTLCLAPLLCGCSFIRHRPQAWEALRSAKVVDLGDNRLRELQAERLQQGTAGLQRLRLAGNQLDSAKGLDAAAWAAVGGMTQLMQLDLGRNLLSILPSDIGSCKVRGGKRGRETDRGREGGGGGDRQRQREGERETDRQKQRETETERKANFFCSIGAWSRASRVYPKP